MDRVMVYPGAIPLETDILSTNKNAMIGLGKLSAALLGTGTLVNGLACTQTTVASMAVSVAPGEIYSLANIDGTAYSSLAADTTHAILKQGILLDAVILALAAPSTVGYSINYLIEATYSDTDANAVVLPYYNASNPSIAYSGPANSGTAQYTTRKGVCTVQAKAGVAATTGTQSTPSVDAGFTALYVVTVAYGAATVVNANISTVSTAPLLPANGLVVGGIQGGQLCSAVAAGTSDALTAKFTPAITQLFNGMSLSVRAGSANATTAPTFNPNGLGALIIVKGNGLALAAGDIAGGGHWIDLQYDLTLNAWVLLNPAQGVTTHGQTKFTSNGSFTVPVGITTVYVTAASGGGGGGGGYATGYCGEGGGGANCVYKAAYTVTPLQVISITIGTGGSGGAVGVAGAAGGSTVVGSLGTLSGGGGGAPGTVGAGGLGAGLAGAGGGGVAGGDGSSIMAGMGGGTLLGPGGTARQAAGTVGCLNSGAGGSGGYINSAGGAGAAGVVIFEY